MAKAPSSRFVCQACGAVLGWPPRADDRVLNGELLSLDPMLKLSRYVAGVFPNFKQRYDDNFDRNLCDGRDRP